MQVKFWSPIKWLETVHFLWETACSERHKNTQCSSVWWIIAGFGHQYNAWRCSKFPWNITGLGQQNFPSKQSQFWSPIKWLDMVHLFSDARKTQTYSENAGFGFQYNAWSLSNSPWKIADLGLQINAWIWSEFLWKQQVLVASKMAGDRPTSREK